MKRDSQSQVTDLRVRFNELKSTLGHQITKGSRFEDIARIYNQILEVERQLKTMEWDPRKNDSTKTVSGRFDDAFPI